MGYGICVECQELGLNTTIRNMACWVGVRSRWFMVISEKGLVVGIELRKIEKGNKG